MNNEFEDFKLWARRMFSEKKLERISNGRIIPVKTEWEYKIYLEMNKKKFF